MPYAREDKFTWFIQTIVHRLRETLQSLGFFTPDVLTGERSLRVTN